ncbi:type IV secretory system conjugative DNA transfer family protein [Nonomuraea turcica]|uniref:type IV secretory system conjugative DNA transfer family protein n=1 Tax=Nonomuraea sp. G32 TaxID=3067274 RepID=UPI00273AF3D5|nr:type IV secretory system conjugative DNA transfer family protein [Nonomuraea sp. G32]MDP4511837.1 TraM recognition domain-containing protein [Nonomuraea sp. G32]
MTGEPLMLAAVRAAPAPPPLAVVIGLAVAALIAVVIVDRLRDPRRRHGLALRWRLLWRMYPGRGYARRLELYRHYGLPAARKVARQARPSLHSWWVRRVVHHREIAVFLGWAQGWIWRFRVYATLEDNLLALAPQKEGKTAHLAGRVIDAPGAVIVTSIRDDIVELTAGLRRGLVHLFNPEQVGEWRSTVRWSPVDGCDDPATAIRRAAHMVAATDTGGLSDQGFWTNQAAMVLAALLHAAALEGLTMAEVDAWALDEDPTPLTILSRRRPGLNTDRAAAQVRRYHALHVRTRDSIFLTLRQVLQCMDDPATAWTLCPPPGDGLDLEDLLRRRETLYLISGDSLSPATPILFSALVAEIHHTARELASRRPSRRLDPPVTFILDEAPEICPITQLPKWLATAAGSGFCFLVGGQSWSQFEHRWGPHGAKTIWNNTKAKMLFGATSDVDDTETMSKLCGQISLPYWEASVDASGKRMRTRRWEMVPVLPPEEARMLRTWRALVVRRNALPTIVRIEKVWKRGDYKRWRAKDGHIPLQRLGPPPAAGHAIGRPADQQQIGGPRAGGRQARTARPWHAAGPGSDL